MRDNKKLMTKENMEDYFKELNRRLKEKGEFGELIMCGGAALAYAYDLRDATYDIDGIYTSNIREAAKEMQRDMGLNMDWLNDGVKGFMTEKMPFSEVSSYSNLSIKSIEMEPLLAMKLSSARYDSKDMEDVIKIMKVLKVTKADEMMDLVERYIPKQFQLPKTKYFAIECVQMYNEIHKKQKKHKKCTR